MQRLTRTAAHFVLSDAAPPPVSLACAAEEVECAAPSLPSAPTPAPPPRPPHVAAVRGRRYNDLLYSVEGKIARITFNRPEKRNALSGQMRDEMTHAMKRAEADDAVSCVLLCGAGPSFCSGYDLTTYDPDFKKAGVLESEHFNSWTDQFARSCVRDWMVIWDLMKPVVAMIQGNCVK